MIKISIFNTFIAILILIILFTFFLKKYIHNFSSIKLILLGIEITLIGTALIASHVENHIMGIPYAIQWAIIIVGIIICFIGLSKNN